MGKSKINLFDPILFTCIKQFKVIRQNREAGIICKTFEMGIQFLLQIYQMMVLILMAEGRDMQLET